MAIDTWRLHGMEVGRIAICLRDIAHIAILYRL